MHVRTRLVSAVKRLSYSVSGPTAIIHHRYSCRQNYPGKARSVGASRPKNNRKKTQLRKLKHTRQDNSCDSCTPPAARRQKYRTGKRPFSENNREGRPGPPGEKGIESRRIKQTLVNPNTPDRNGHRANSPHHSEKKHRTKSNQKRAPGHAPANADSLQPAGCFSLARTPTPRLSPTANNVHFTSRATTLLGQCRAIPVHGESYRGKACLRAIGTTRGQTLPPLNTSRRSAAKPPAPVSRSRKSNRTLDSAVNRRPQEGTISREGSPSECNNVSPAPRCRPPRSHPER